MPTTPSTFGRNPRGDSDSAAKPARSDDRRATWLVIVTVLAAIGFTRLAWTGPLAHGLLFWFAVTFIGELMWVRLPLGGATLSMASCSHFAALLLLPRGQAMVLVALSSAIVERGVMGKPMNRVAFNAAQSALAVGASSLVLALCGGGPDLRLVAASGVAWLPLLGAAITYFLFNSGAVSVAIALAERTRLIDAWWRNFGSAYELLSSGALFSLGVLLALLCQQFGPGAAVLVLCPVAIAYQSYRLYSVRVRMGDERGPRAAPPGPAGESDGEPSLSRSA